MQSSKTKDHRVGVAKVRREKMEARLLQSVMECYGVSVQDGPPTVEDVVARAKVSRQTFYKYFRSIDEAIETRASELVDEMIESLQHMVGQDKAPVLLFAISVDLFLSRSVLDPTWAAFVARSDLLQGDGELFKGMSFHLNSSRDESELSFTDADAAMTLAVGTMREAIALISKSEYTSREYLDEVIKMILIGLGASRKRATTLTAQANTFIDQTAPERLPWWSPPWPGGS